MAPFVISGGCQDKNISVDDFGYALTFLGFPGIRELPDPPGLLVGIGVVGDTAK